MAVAVVAVLHGDLLRTLTDAFGDADGLSVVARRARKQGRVSNQLCKKLIRIDDAFAIIRHATSSKAQQLLQHLHEELAKPTQPVQKDTAPEPKYTHAGPPNQQVAASMEVDESEHSESVQHQPTLGDPKPQVAASEEAHIIESEHCGSHQHKPSSMGICVGPFTAACPDCRADTGEAW